jgi:FkbM family methyltransferase
MLRVIRADPRVRALARSVPGLSPLWHGVRKRIVLARGTARLDYPRATLRVRARTRAIVDLRLTPTDKEPWTVAWIERNLGPGDVLYDVGANIGVYSLIAAAIEPHANVVAFEPAYATFAELCENLQLNGVGERVLALPLVLGDRTRIGTLRYHDTAAGAAIHRLDATGGAYSQPVLVHAVDDLIERFGLAAPTLVKLDVDGGETAVLAGARRTLARPELRSLIVEVEDEQTEGVLATLQEAGFRVVSRIDERAGSPLPGVWYGVFER